jgi:hypothetical protein
MKEIGSRQVRYGDVEGTGWLGIAEPEIVKKLSAKKIA